MGRKLAVFVRRRPLECGWLLLLLLAAVFAPQLTHHDPYTVDFGQRFLTPSGAHLLGTDNYGRDVLTRVVYGSRIVLYSVLLSAAISLSGGMALGVSAGYLGGRFDLIVSRFSDAVQSFPAILLGVLFAAAMGASLDSAILAAGVFGVPIVARVVRGEVLRIREMEFVEASRALGATPWHIMRKCIVRNIVGVVIVQISGIGPFAVMTVAGLSFLGLGAQPPEPCWGHMISEARAYMYQHPTYLISVVAVLSVTIIALNMLGDGLRDVMARRNGS